MHTVVIGFHQRHVAPAIKRLDQDGVINIKCWLSRLNGKKVDGIDDMTPANTGQRGMILNANNYANCPQAIYESIYAKYYSFFVIHNRWTQYFDCNDNIHDFNCLVGFWYKTFTENDIKLLMLDVFPHAGVTFVAYLLAKIMKINVMIFAQMIFMDNKFTIEEDIENFGKYFSIRRILNFHSGYMKIEKKYEKNIQYMDKIEPYYNFGGRVDFWATLKRGILKGMKCFFHPKAIWNKMVPVLLFHLRSIYSEDNYLKNDRLFCQVAEIDGDYVYFPLHLQPEMTTDALGGEYENQLLCIAQLSRIIPNDWRIAVKENPKQSYYKRGNRFFECLQEIPKVLLVSRHTDTYKLIRESKFVATITGTVGWEAISGGKNVLVFGNAWYRELPGVFEYENITSIEEIVNYKINHCELEEKFATMIDYMYDGVIKGSQNIESSRPTSPWCRNYDENSNHECVYSSIKYYIEYKYNNSVGSKR